MKTKTLDVVHKFLNDFSFQKKTPEIFVLLADKENSLLLFEKQ